MTGSYVGNPDEQIPGKHFDTQNDDDDESSAQLKK
jgi:hypothetical protein